MTETRDCTQCNGTGVTVMHAFRYDGKDYPERRKSCVCCAGTGKFSPPDNEAIEAAIKGRDGLRSAKPKDRRAYYVWRLARFHGGKDMSIPVMASIDVHGDPYIKELEALADAMAKKYLGSDMKAARRWGRALGVL